MRTAYLGKRRPLAMLSSQLQPMPGDGDGHLDLSSIGRTNILHSEEEQQYIRNVLLAAESLLQSGTVDDDLQRWEETVDLIDRCKIALAPHKILPPDVLRSIFRFCGEAGVQFPIKSMRYLHLLRITHVCSAWRQLALEIPVLWSDITIYITPDDEKDYDETLSSARQWFDRAQDMRRSLSIYFDIGVSPHRQDLWEKLLGFMAQYRLEELELTYPINHIALKLPDHVWPSIERLHLMPSLDGLGPGGQQLFLNFGKLSNLRHLEISSSSNLDGIDRIIPWHQLRTFEMRGWICECRVTPSLILNALRQSRLLEYCRITLSKESSFTSTVIPTEENIVLANMDCFRVQFRDGLVVPMFLQPLVMPNITTFSLKGGSILVCDMPPLIGIIQRSGGMRRIRRLDVGYTSATLDIGILLELLPSLESISIKCGRLSDNSIKRLSSGKLGPRLCEICSNVKHDADQILSMVESRHHNATQSLDNEDAPCPFECIWIYCQLTLNKSVYRDRIDLLFEKCKTWISLDADVE